MGIVLSIIVILIISFLWALYSLNKALKKIDREERKAIKNQISEMEAGREIVLFERKN